MTHCIHCDLCQHDITFLSLFHKLLFQFLIVFFLNIYLYLHCEVVVTGEHIVRLFCHFHLIVCGSIIFHWPVWQYKPLVWYNMFPIGNANHNASRKYLTGLTILGLKRPIIWVSPVAACWHTIAMLTVHSCGYVRQQGTGQTLLNCGNRCILGLADSSVLSEALQILNLWGCQNSLQKLALYEGNVLTAGVCFQTCVLRQPRRWTCTWCSSHSWHTWGLLTAPMSGSTV